MSASGVQGWPVAGIRQTRTVAPASGTPRELKTMSSLREPCACAGATAHGQMCSASARMAQKNGIVLAPALAGDAIFDRIMRAPHADFVAHPFRGEGFSRSTVWLSPPAETASGLKA